MTQQAKNKFHFSNSTEVYSQKSLHEAEVTGTWVYFIMYRATYIVTLI